MQDIVKGLAGRPGNGIQSSKYSRFNAISRLQLVGAYNATNSRRAGAGGASMRNSNVSESEFEAYEDEEIDVVQQEPVYR